MKAVKGDDYQNKGQDHKTFGITITDAWINIRGELQPHGNMVEVYRTEAVRDRILTLLERHGFTDEPQAGAGGGVVGWQDIKTAPKKGPPILLGIVYSGRTEIEEVHLGGYRFAINDDELDCWWSDQADDEIRPSFWAPMPPVLAALAPSPSAGEIGIMREAYLKGWRTAAAAAASPPATPAQPTASVGAVRSAVVAALKQAASGGASGLADYEIDEIADDLLASLSKECDTCMNGFLATDNPCPDCGRVARP